MLFPLRLTPFEEYMLLDDQPAYPMSCFFKVKLQGRFNVKVFESALEQALKNHPLLTCLVKETKGQFYWHNTEKMPKIIRLPLDADRPFPYSCGIDLFCEPALKITICNDNPNPTEFDLAGHTDIIFEFHHSAGDASGVALFIEDVLCYYARQRDFVVVQRESVEPALLIRRGRFRWNLRVLPKQLWGLTRAWMFLMNRIIPLTNRKPLDTSKPDADFPAILCKKLTEVQTQNVLQRVKQLGITINDYFLGTTFLAMSNWREQNQQSFLLGERIGVGERGNLRIAVPINLRTKSETRMPAANIVSMVFLDRKPETIEPTQSFYQGIHREMQHIKRCNLGWAFIHGLTLYRRIFGSFLKMMKPERCWASATVTNLGYLFNKVPLPIWEGRVQVDDFLELMGIEAAPPVRNGTALGICVVTYADRMTINLHYDSNVLSCLEAQAILDDFVRGYAHH